MEKYQQLEKVLVTHKNLDEVVKVLEAARKVGFDTETYGLLLFDKMFSMQFAVGDTAYYFNFKDYGDGTPILDIDYTLECLEKVFSDKGKIWYIHNAKFDLHRLWHYSTFIEGRVRCTNVWARLVYNVHFVYSLAACLKRIGLAKDDEVEKYISKHKLYTAEAVRGKSKPVKYKHYDKVPFEIMFPYGCMDAWAVLKLGEYLHDKVMGYGTPEALIVREEKLVHVAAKMEQRGVELDVDYVQKGWDYEERKLEEVEKELSVLAGRPFKNGPKWLAETFDKYGVEYNRNAKTGNPEFDKDSLDKIDHPIAAKVREYRRGFQYINTYYSSFQYNIDKYGGKAHATIKLGGTDTGRFSYSGPNLQNVPKEDEEGREIYVRKCIKPRAGFNLVAIDFSQQEFRLMLDYACEKRLIARIVNGEDVHQATADEVEITRKHAKTLNFGLLYGMGIDALAAMLKIAVNEARKTKDRYFAKLPMVEFFIQKVIRTAKMRGYIETWAGRRLWYTDKEFCYKAPNGLIQGGSADMVREAMILIDELFVSRDMESGMVIQVHDELLFEIKEDEMYIVPTLRNIMKNVYKPFNGMAMDCSVETSKVSWGKCDMEEIDV